MSLPTRERGLKYSLYLLNLVNASVAPYAGAWIEIPIPSSYLPQAPSLPTRERGLKFYRLVLHDLIPLSLPTRERGLKSLHLWGFPSGDGVAPYAGAWIEIRRGLSGKSSEKSVAPYAGAWIEINGYFVFNESSGRSLRGSVD